MNLKIFFVLIAWSSLVFLTSSCALQTRNEAAQDQQEKEMQSQFSSIQKRNADANERISQLEDMVRVLNGKIEVLENNHVVQVKQNNQINNEVNAELAKKILILEEEIKSLRQSVSEAKSSNPDYHVSANKLKSSDDKVSDRGLDKDYIKNGDVYLDQKDWKKAILQYQNYRDKFPKGKRIAEATYKIGVGFQELGLKDDAKSFYDEVIEKYPQSLEAKKSKQRLKSIR